ncbi:MAG: LptF/LptG family permease [Henriciella sp.]|nr:LptF/LptG family permease [Henriciella sp.]
MKLVRSYFARLFLARWFVTTFALLALLSVVDSIGAADILPEDSGSLDALKYTLLRLPSLYDRIFMFALFVSLLLTFLSLIRRQELVGFVSMSISPLMQVRALIPMVLLISIASLLVIDQTLPRTVSALERWLGSDAFMEEDAGKPRSLWIADANSFVEIGTIQGSELSDLTVYLRDGAGRISSITRAESAQYRDTSWVLSGATSISLEYSETPPLQIWQTDQTPVTLQKLGTSPRNLSLSDQYNLAQLRGSGVRPSTAYLVWFFDRLTMPLIAIGFVLVAVPLMQALGRRQTGDQRLMIGIAIGFGYFIFDGVLKTVAEGGGISLPMAIGLPILLLLGLGIHLNLKVERVK